MNSISPAMALARQDQFGRRVAARLDAGADELPHDITERLRAARVQALARRQVGLQAAQTVSASAGQATLTGDEHVSLWRRLASVLPLLVLAAGLVTIHVIQNERRASEVAEVGPGGLGLASRSLRHFRALAGWRVSRGGSRSRTGRLRRRGRRLDGEQERTGDKPAGREPRSETRAVHAPPPPQRSDLRNWTKPGSA